MFFLCDHTSHSHNWKWLRGPLFQATTRNIIEQWIVFLPWLKKIIWLIGVRRRTVGNWLAQDSNHPDDLFQSRYVTHGFKPFSQNSFILCKFLLVVTKAVEKTRLKLFLFCSSFINKSCFKNRFNVCAKRSKTRRKRKRFWGTWRCLYWTTPFARARLANYEATPLRTNGKYMSR